MKVLGFLFSSRQKDQNFNPEIWDVSGAGVVASHSLRFILISKGIFVHTFPKYRHILKDLCSLLTNKISIYTVQLDRGGGGGGGGLLPTL